MEHFKNDGPPEVIFIDADQELLQSIRKRQLRVAAYCRVSTDSEEQATSYETQQRAYRSKIAENPEWRLVDIFAEEVSGTSAEKRSEFMKMIRQCRKKKIDLILTKSISRFARNTLDSLKYIRELRELGVGVVFEKENLNTLDTKSEVFITILSSLAQEESNSISGNVKHGKRMRMKQGLVDFRPPYGYRLDDDKTPYIIDSEAEVVQLIFHEYLKGLSERDIQSLLRKKAIYSPSGKDTWNISTIQSMIQNEKYCGDVLMQKSFTTDPLTKKTKVNRGELPKVLVRNHHSPIISREMFQKATVERAKRKSKQKVSESTKTMQGKYSSKFALTDILVCGNCGTPYRRTTWARAGRKKIVWRCINRLENGKKYCTYSPTLNEEILEQAIVTAMNDTRNSRKNLLPYLKAKIERIYTSRDSGVDAICELEERIKELTAATMSIIESGEDMSAHLDRLSELGSEIQRLQTSLDGLKAKAETEYDVTQKVGQAIEIMESLDEEVERYDDALVRQSIDTIRVMGSDRLLIVFKDGFEWEQAIEEARTAATA